MLRESYYCHNAILNEKRITLSESLVYYLFTTIFEKKIYDIKRHLYFFFIVSDPDCFRVTASDPWKNWESH